MASDRERHYHQFVRFISLDFLSHTKIKYEETNYDADNIDKDK